MAAVVGMPRLGMIMSEGTVTRWLAAQGAAVKRGDLLAEISTDKITYEIEAPEAGVVHHVVAEGAVVAVEGALAYILAEGEAPPAAVAAAPGATSDVPPAGVAPRRAVSGVAAVPAGEVRSSPAARKLAQAQGIDLATVRGTGPGGRIVEQDILRAAGEREAAPAPQRPRAPAQRIPLAGARGVIARRMLDSLRNAAQLTLSVEADAGVLLQVPAVPPARDAALVRVVALALREQPLLNSTVEGNEVVVAEDINIGLAVSADEALVVPVIRNADRKSHAEISRELRDLMRRARRNGLTLDDLSGGTFTISNLGGYAVDAFTPILNPPQTGILGAGRVAERPVVVDGQLTVRATVHLSLTFDHRAADGAPAARLLTRIVELLQNPATLGGNEGA